MTPPTNIQIGKRIRRDREAAGLSREGLADRAKLSYKTVERIEAGASNPRRSTLHLIEVALKEAA